MLGENGDEVLGLQMTESLIVITILAFGTLCVLFSRILFGIWINPLMIYSAVWGSVFSGYHLNLLGYYTVKPTDSLYTIVILSWLGFLMGSLLVWFAFERQKKRDRAILAAGWFNFFALHEYQIRRTTTYTSIIAFLLGIAGLYYLFTHFSLSEFLLDYSRIRGQTGVPGGLGYDDIGYKKSPFFQVIAMGFSLASVAVSSVYVGAYRRRYFLVVLPLFGCVFLSLAELSRSRLLDVLLIFFVGYYFGSRFSGKKISLKPLVYILIFLVSYFLVLSSLGKRTGEGVQGASSPLERAGAVIYIRLTSPLHYLDDYINRKSPEPWFGEASFNPVYRLLYAVGLAQNYRALLNLEPSLFNPDWVAAQPPSYLKWFYVDFGMYGIWMLAFTFGCIVSIPFAVIMSRVSLNGLLFSIVFFPAVYSTYGTWRLQDHFFAVEVITAILISYAIGSNKTSMHVYGKA